MRKPKFEFDIEFQWKILHYILRDKDGHKALGKINPFYFETDHQQLLAKCINRYYTKSSKLPQDSITLLEELRTYFKTKTVASAYTKEDYDTLRARIKNIYSKPNTDGEDVRKKISDFKKFVNFTNAVEKLDFGNFESYEKYADNIYNAIRDDEFDTAARGVYLVAEHNKRLNNNMGEDFIESPFSAMNKLTSAGGLSKGSIVVFMDIAKGGKTALLVNIARMRLTRPQGRSRAKKILMIDLENGEIQMATRFDQSLNRLSKDELKQGVTISRTKFTHPEKPTHDYNPKTTPGRRTDLIIKKMYRKINRLGGEVHIRRLPALSNANAIRKVIDDIYREYGWKPDELIVDYIGLMNSIQGHKEDTDRISNAYIDVKNLAQEYGIDVVWTGHHVVREAKRDGFRASRFHTSHLAKCIDIERHVDAIYGIQQNAQEKIDSIIRLEVVVQRDGDPDGRIYLWQELETQRIEEFTEAQVRKNDFYITGECWYKRERIESDDEVEKPNKEKWEKNKPTMSKNGSL